MRSRMMVIPRLVSHWWEAMERPHRLMDQHFGLAMRPENFFNSSLFERRFPAAYSRIFDEMMREEEKHFGYSMINADKDKFRVALDVRQFKPEEINVKVVDNLLVIEGKHEDKEDDHGVIARHFIRKYMIPEECDPEKAASTLSSDGILTITAPVKPESIEEKNEKVLKIEHTGKPANEQKNEEPQEGQRRISQNQ